ncbi:hypothetical protein HD597_005231 [Nonomuraea thailandensis]|uniref:Uncharacterized protein n=1 Tax=Nonomuraea thailandensis TaxID=1188745 RepID=A0A9X2K617_9ACTN|nr:hypothetical protein [Nonomuraea thailandensis]MCP2358211.1 hypothetical protein [Nonomuraea thailandensis]
MDDDYRPFARTDLAVAALSHARDLEHPAAFNHGMRSHLYGRFIGEEQGQRPGVDGQALAEPHKAPPFTLPGELLRRHPARTGPPGSSR